jgi:hypothetical protein
MSIARGCELMGIARSTYYEAPSAKPDDLTLIAAITDICNEFGSLWLAPCPRSSAPAGRGRQPQADPGV